MHLLGLFVVLNLADVVMTHVNLSIGPGVEANPFILMVIERFGWAGIYWFKVIGPLLLTAVILQIPACRLMSSKWFSWFLVLSCLVSLTGICNGIWISTTSWSG